MLACDSWCTTSFEIALSYLLSRLAYCAILYHRWSHLMHLKLTTPLASFTETLSSGWNYYSKIESSKNSKWCVHWNIADHRDYLWFTMVWLFNDKVTNTNWFLMNESHVIVITQLRAYKNLHFIAHFKCFIAKFSNYWFCVQCNHCSMDLTFFSQEIVDVAKNKRNKKIN